MRKRKILAAFLTLAAVAGGAVLLDHGLAGPDRVYLERARAKRQAPRHAAAARARRQAPRGEVFAADEAIVLEAELFQKMSYGWQIGLDESAAGGAYIHVKEGVGDFESEDAIARNPSVRAGDFYNITGHRGRIEARLYVTSPDAGSYQLFARTMANRSK